MFDIIAHISTNLFRTFTVFRFLNIFLSTRKGKLAIAVACGLFYTVTLGMYFMFQSIPVNFICNLTMTYFLTWCYQGKQRKKILIAVLIYGINMFCDVLAVFILSDYSTGGIFHQVAPYLTTTIFAICEYITERFFIRKSRKESIPPYWGIMVLVPVISILMLNSMVILDLNNRYLLLSISIGLLLINLFILILYDLLTGFYERLQEQRLFERQIAGYSHQLELMMQGEENLSIFRHDMKHHLHQIYLMAKKNDVDNIREYISQMQLFMENDKEYCSCGNKDVDSLLNYLIHKAKSVLKEVSYEIKLPGLLEIKTLDINIILGNLLENAIEAAMNSQEKILKIEIKYDKGILYMGIQNTYDGRLKKKGDTLLTTKSDMKNHGMGLKSVKRVVESYQGVLEIDHDHEIFEVRVIMYV